MGALCRKMRRVACCFLVRNGATYLERNVAAIEAALAGGVDKLRFFYIENNGSDATRTILDLLGADRPGRFEGEQLELSGESSVELCRGAASYNFQATTSFLASLRQRVLERALGWEECTAVLMLDLDMVRFESVDPLRLLRLIERTGADGAFGMSVVDGCDGPACYYDTGALRASERANRRIADGQVAAVRSAFSGFGMYSAASLRCTGAHYDTKADGIEHLAFNRVLGHLVVDGSFRPVYVGGTGSKLTWLPGLPGLPGLPPLGVGLGLGVLALTQLRGWPVCPIWPGWLCLHGALLMLSVAAALLFAFRRNVECAEAIGRAAG